MRNTVMASFYFLYMYVFFIFFIILFKVNMRLWFSFSSVLVHDNNPA